MSPNESLSRRLIRAILAFLLDWFYRGSIDVCSVCEQSYENCACEVDQVGDDIETASLRQEIRWLRAMLTP